MRIFSVLQQLNDSPVIMLSGQVHGFHTPAIGQIQVAAVRFEYVRHFAEPFHGRQMQRSGTVSLLGVNKGF